MRIIYGKPQIYSFRYTYTGTGRMLCATNRPIECRESARGSIAIFLQSIGFYDSVNVVYISIYTRLCEYMEHKIKNTLITLWFIACSVAVRFFFGVFIIWNGESLSYKISDSESLSSSEIELFLQVGGCTNFWIFFTLAQNTRKFIHRHTHTHQTQEEMLFDSRAQAKNA